MRFALEADGLVKTYGAVRALDGLSLRMPAGGVFGVLGPNGAGKSTLFRIALGLVRPTSGTARLFGAPAGQASSLRRVGSMIETPRYPPYLTARDVLRMLALESGVSGSVDIDYWLERGGLGGAADRKAGPFPVGMEQRPGRAAAFFPRPEVVILAGTDSGTDPAGIPQLRALIRDLADKEGVTIILASHQLDEVRRVCDRVAILSKGKLAAEGDVEALTGGKPRLRLSVSPVDTALAVLGDKGEPDGPNAVLADVLRAETPALIRALVEAGVEITEARWREGDLESAYLGALEPTKTTEGAA